MRSFLGRDILSLKDMEREEFFEIFVSPTSSSLTPKSGATPTC